MQKKCLNIKIFDNGHEANLETLRRPLKIKDSDKAWAVGAKPALILKVS